MVNKKSDLQIIQFLEIVIKFGNDDKDDDIKENKYYLKCFHPRAPKCMMNSILSAILGHKFYTLALVSL